MSLLLVASAHLVKAVVSAVAVSAKDGSVAVVTVNAADGMMRCGSGLLRVVFVAVVRPARVRASIWRLLRLRLIRSFCRVSRCRSTVAMRMVREKSRLKRSRVMRFC